MDGIHKRPRWWSNNVLKRVAHIFEGDVVNVSAWEDNDKEGRRYKEYFVSARSYSITNFVSDKRGFQGADGEIFLDLEKDLPVCLIERFSCVFNHTTLEHIYDFRKAFDNLCAMSSDAVILVVPFMQQMHSNYEDYWRFSPLALVRMFEDKGFHIGLLEFNNQPMTSVYITVVAVKNKENYIGKLPFYYSFIDPSAAGFSEPFAGSLVFSSGIQIMMHNIKAFLAGLLK